MNAASEQRSPTASGASRGLLFAILGLVVLVVAVYAPATRYPFVAFDDPQYVTENPFVRDGWTWAGVQRAFDVGYASNWHPLTWMSHMLDVELFGMDAGFHHLTNIWLHAFNAVLVLLLLRGLLARATAPRFEPGVVDITALFAAAAFALHPLRLESVVWISERKDLLSAGLGLMTLLAYLRYARRPGWARYVAVPLLLALGLAAKPMLVSLPLLMLMLDFWPLDRWGAGEPAAVFRRRLALLAEKLPLFALAAGSAWITLVAQSSRGAVSDFETLPFGERVANAAVAYGAYLVDFVWPLGRSVFYPYPLEGWPWWQVAAGGAAFVGISALAALAVGRRPWFAVGWGWYVILLVPVIGLVQVGMQSRADRYTYLPHLGLVLIASGLCASWLTPRREPRRPLALAAILITGVLAIATSFQLRFWRDTTTLFERALAVTHQNYLAHHALSNEYHRAGDLQSAIHHAREVVGLHPSYWRGQNQLGFCLAAAGRIDEALPHLREAIRLAPDWPDGHFDLGTSLLNAGRVEESVGPLERALELTPEFVAARLNLGAAHERLGRTEAALREYERALAAGTMRFEAHLSLATLLARLERDSEAVVHYEAALRLRPQDGRPHAFLAALDLRRGDVDSAMARVELLRTLDPSLAQRVLARIEGQRPQQPEP